MNNKLKGTLFGVVAAVAYGTNPLFSLPLYAQGMTPDSVLFINISIKAIGSTYAAIIGALEPVTALMIGVFVFGESFTVRIALGALLIVFAVILVVSQNVVVAGLKKGWHKLR